MNKPLNVHGTALLLGAVGVLLRGPSGAGKSLLALALLDRWEARGLEAWLVADDRVELTLTGNDLWMSAPPALQGLIELRGRGIVHRPHRNAVVLSLVIDLVGDRQRMPEAEALATEIAGITLPRAPVPAAGVVELGHQVLLVAEAVRALAGARQKTT